MIDKARITINAISSIVQIVLSGTTVFFLYRFLLQAIGAPKVGIWAVVLATSSMVQTANLGVTGSILKYIADYHALEDERQISLAVQTAVISIALFSFVLVVCLFPLAKYYFQFALEHKFYREALEVLPFALSAFWVFMLTGIYQSALYGCQLIAHRNAILVFDSISHLVICILLARSYGLLGLAYARLVQNCLTLAITIFVLKKYVKALPLFPRRWSKSLFKEMFTYALNFQAISLLVIMADPVTKGFLSKYGNVSMVAYYQMSNRLVQMFRSLLVSTNQVLVPVFANLKQLEPQRILTTYFISYRLIFYLALPGFSLLAVSTPLISKIWIGQFESVFIWSTVMLCGGWLINTLSVPAYYADMGTGNMTYNVITHLIMTLSNVVLILTIGQLRDGLGVVMAWSIAVALGGCVLNVFYYRRNGISFSNTVPNESRLLMSLCLIGLIIAYQVWQLSPSIQNLILFMIPSTPSVQYIVAIVVIACFLIIAGLPMWKHYMRKRVIKLFMDIRS